MNKPQDGGGLRNDGMCCRSCSSDSVSIAVSNVCPHHRAPLNSSYWEISSCCSIQRNTPYIGRIEISTLMRYACTRARVFSLAASM